MTLMILWYKAENIISRNEQGEAYNISINITQIDIFHAIIPSFYI